MTYPIKKIWIVLTSTASGEVTPFWFRSRYYAHQCFTHAIKAIKALYPNGDTFEHNIHKAQGNAYYGLVNKPIYVRLLGLTCNCSLRDRTPCLNTFIEQLQEELEYDI